MYYCIMCSIMYMNIGRDQKGSYTIQNNTTTPETTHFPLFKAKCENELPQMGFEPTTSRFPGKCSSYQLSYRGSSAGRGQITQHKAIGQAIQYTITYTQTILYYYLWFSSIITVRADLPWSLYHDHVC